MKKTNRMAVIGQYNPMSGQYTHIERRVYEDENGIFYVKINGEMTSVAWLKAHKRTVQMYF